MKNIKLILFDIDNTLVFGDEAKVFYGRYSRVLEERLAELLKVSFVEAKQIADEYREKYNGQGERAYEDLLGDISPWYEAILGISPSEYLISHELVNDLLLSLKQKGYMLGAVTDGPTHQANIILEITGIDKTLFDLFMGWEPHSVRPKGGKSDVFNGIAERYGLSPQEIVMIGDSLGTDILPAVEVGLQAIHISEQADKGDRWRTVMSVLQLETIF